MGGRGGRAVQAPGLARTKLWLIAGTLSCSAGRENGVCVGVWYKEARRGWLLRALFTMRRSLFKQGKPLEDFKQVVLDQIWVLES